MSDVVLVALVTGAPVMVTAVAGLIVSLRNGRKVDDAARAQQSNSDAAAAKQQEIHVLVNSNLSKVKADLETAKTEIAALHALLRDLTVDRLQPPKEAA